MNYIDTSTKGKLLRAGNYEISHNKLMLKSLLPDEVKVFISIEDITLKSKLITNKAIWFTKKPFF